jgi:hypothetical protein
MNIRKHRKLEGEIKTCSILIKNQKYYVCFSCEVETQPKLDTKLITLDRQIGIDVVAKSKFCSRSLSHFQPNLTNNSVN